MINWKIVMYHLKWYILSNQMYKRWSEVTTTCSTLPQVQKTSTCVEEKIQSYIISSRERREQFNFIEWKRLCKDAILDITLFAQTLFEMSTEEVHLFVNILYQSTPMCGQKRVYGEFFYPRNELYNSISSEVLYERNVSPLEILTDYARSKLYPFFIRSTSFYSLSDKLMGYRDENEPAIVLQETDDDSLEIVEMDYYDKYSSE